MYADWEERDDAQLAAAVSIQRRISDSCVMKSNKVRDKEEQQSNHEMATNQEISWSVW